MARRILYRYCWRRNNEWSTGFPSLCCNYRSSNRFTVRDNGNHDIHSRNRTNSVWQVYNERRSAKREISCRAMKCLNIIVRSVANQEPVEVLFYSALLLQSIIASSAEKTSAQSQKRKSGDDARGWNLRTP